MPKLIDAQEAIDILEITRVLYTNFRATDAKNFDKFETTLADAVAIDFGAVQLAKTVTAKELRAQSEPTYARVKTQHMSTNLDIRVDGDKAKSTSYGHARHERTDKEGFWHIYARYENDYIRTTKGWKISRIKMEPRWQEGNPKLLEETAAAEKSAS